MKIDQLKLIYTNCLFCKGYLCYENDSNIYSGSFVCKNKQCINFKVLILPTLSTINNEDKLVEFEFWGYNIIAHGFHIYFWPTGITVFQSVADINGIRGNVHHLKCNEFTIDDAIKEYKTNNLNKFKKLSILK